MTTPSLPVVEFERRPKRRAWPTLLFMGYLGGLLALAIVSLVIPPRHPSGLPDDERARRAAGTLEGVPVATSELRFVAAALGGEPRNAMPGAAALERVRTAYPTLERTLHEHPMDPRAHAALAALDMASHDWPRAAARYRAAIEHAPHYGEARLGTGVALALQAERMPDLWQARALMLQAVAQFAAVDSGDAAYPAALYDRALLLYATGRTREAAWCSQHFFALDSTSRWAYRLRVESQTAR